MTTDGLLKGMLVGIVILVGAAAINACSATFSGNLMQRQHPALHAQTSAQMKELANRMATIEKALIKIMEAQDETPTTPVPAAPAAPAGPADELWDPQRPLDGPFNGSDSHGGPGP